MKNRWPAAKTPRVSGPGPLFAVVCRAHRGHPRSAPRISAQRTAPAQHVYARERRMRRVRGASKLVRHCLCRNPGRDRERRDRGGGGGRRSIRGVLAADQRFSFVRRCGRFDPRGLVKWRCVRTYKKGGTTYGLGILLWPDVHTWPEQNTQPISVPPSNEKPLAGR